MKACGALLFVLLCVCEAAPDVQLSLTHQDDQGTELELTLNHHHDHDHGTTEDAVCVNAKMVEALLAQLSTLEARLNATERHIADQREVAFSAYDLGSGYVGPYNKSTNTLVYKRVHTNIGNAYNTSTGYFSAQIRGVYYLRFTAASRGEKSSSNSSEVLWIFMYKNNQRLIDNYGSDKHGGLEYISNAVIEELDQGDTVEMRLPGGYRLFDKGSENHNTFSGFLLYSK